MVKDLLTVDAKDSKLQLEKLKDSVKETNVRIEKLQDLLVDGKIDSNQYSETMSRYSNQKQSLVEEIERLKKVDSDYIKWLKNGVDALSNLKSHYLNSTIRDKQQLISSIFPEKFEFDGKKCRTLKMNDFLLEMLLKDNELAEKNRGQILKKLDLSSWVGRAGFEPAKT